MEGKDYIVVFSDQRRALDWLPGTQTHKSGKLLGRKGSPKATCEKSLVVYLLADCDKTTFCFFLSLTKEANECEAYKSGAQ